MMMSGMLKCEVCGKITQVKINVGISNEFPIFIPCKCCGTVFNGRYIKNDDLVEANTKFINAKEVSNQNEMADFICTITGDFISQKISDINCANDTITFPEWMEFNNRIGRENMQELFANFQELMNTREKAQFEWARIMDLWFNNKYEFLVDQLDYFLDIKKRNIPLCKKQDYIREIKHLTVAVFHSVFFNNEYGIFIKEIKNVIKHISEVQPQNMKAFINKIGNMDLYIPIEKMIYERMKDFLKYIPDLLPIFSLKYLSDDERNSILNKNFEYGIFTTSFDKIKPLYIDLFETAIKTSVIPVGLNNLNIRGSHNSFKNSRIRKLEDYHKLDKSFEKMKYLDNNIFTSNLSNNLNNQLRNSIGHCDYFIDDLNQLINYNKGKKQIPLSNVVYSCYELFLYLVKTFVIVTVLHEAYYNELNE